MKVKVGKTYRCGKIFVSIIHQYPTSMGCNYVGVTSGLNGAVDADFTTVAVGLFNSDGESARHSSGLMQHKLEEVEDGNNEK